MVVSDIAESLLTEVFYNLGTIMMTAFALSVSYFVRLAQRTVEHFSSMNMLIAGIAIFPMGEDMISFLFKGRDELEGHFRLTILLALEATMSDIVKMDRSISLYILAAIMLTRIPTNAFIMCKWRYIIRAWAVCFSLAGLCMSIVNMRSRLPLIDLHKLLLADELVDLTLLMSVPIAASLLAGINTPMLIWDL